MKEKIYVGITNNNELYYVEIEQPSEQHKYFSMSGTSLSLYDATNGEQDAEDMIRDGDFWKEAVQAGNTTLGEDDWVEWVLAVDGWKSMFDFDSDIGERELNGTLYFFSFQSGGQHEETAFKKMFIPKAAWNTLLSAWHKYHLKKKTVTLPKIEQNKDEIIQQTIEYIVENQ